MKQKTKTVTIRLTDEVKTNLKLKAESHGITMSELITKLIQAL